MAWKFNCNCVILGFFFGFGGCFCCCNISGSFSFGSSFLPEIGALGDLVCEGVPTTAKMHVAILSSPAFRAGQYDTRDIPGWSSE